MLLLVGACTSNNPDGEGSATTSDASSVATDAPDSSESTEASSEMSSEVESPETTAAVADPFADIEGPAPGVSDDAIKIGVTYVDAESLRASGLELDLGDYEGTFQAIADDINANGGVNGRSLELIFAPVAPSDPAGTEAACTKLTEDDDVFMVTGFFLGDAHLCPLEIHDTAVVGASSMTAEQVDRARAPWITPLVDGDLLATSIATFADSGILDGTVGTFSHERDQADLDAVLAELANQGISVAETGIIDAPSGDVAAVSADVQVMEELFKSADVDTLVLVGSSAENWLSQRAESDYSPAIVSASLTALQAYVTNEATTDTAGIDGAVAGGRYGPDQAIFEAMADCAAVVEAAGVEVITPDEAAVDDSQAYQALFLACPYLAAAVAWMEAAGPNLNYGTLDAALEQGFSVTLPGEVTARNYAPFPAADGNPASFIFAWDEAAGTFVRQG